MRLGCWFVCKHEKTSYEAGGRGLLALFLQWLARLEKSATELHPLILPTPHYNSPHSSPPTHTNYTLTFSLSTLLARLS